MIKLVATVSSVAGQPGAGRLDAGPAAAARGRTAAQGQGAKGKGEPKKKGEREPGGDAEQGL